MKDGHADEETHTQVASVLIAVSNAVALRGVITMPLMMADDVTATLTQTAARSNAQSSARRSIEVLTTLVGIAAEIGRPVEPAGLALIGEVVAIIPQLCDRLRQAGPPVKMQCGSLASSVGPLRMAAVLLLEALMRAEQPGLVHGAFLEHNVMELLLGMLLSYPTSNMLHNSVQRTLLTAIHSTDAALRQCLLGPSCGLLQRLLTQVRTQEIYQSPA